MKKLSLASLVSLALIFLAGQAIGASPPPPKGAVLTWHDDNFRTGWQQQETILTTATVGKLGIAHAVTLKDSVYAQPLVIPGFIGGHDIAYIVDLSNTVYQIDANTGVIRTKINLGSPISSTRFGCGGGPRTGIESTPVIDWATQTLFAVAKVNLTVPPQPVSPAYFLHALDLVSLKDKVTPLQIAASHILTNGKTVFAFNAAYQRQRAALLFANGKVYAAFASLCDTNASLSRGWVLGWSWNGTALAALPANQLNDRQLPPPYGFLDTIWMTSAGPASDETGNLYFSTGNSNADAVTKVLNWTDNVPCPGTATGTPPTNVGCSNIQESVVKLKGDLTTITGLFSPNAHYGTFTPDTLKMDETDDDLGSGGVLLAPQLGTAFLAAQAGKDGRLWLFDRSGTGLKLLQFRQGLPCWCAPSYFTGPDGVGRIVASQGKEIQTFKIPPAQSLTPEGTSLFITGQDPGFFTTVSCNGVGAFGNCTNTPLIWAVSRPFAVVTSNLNLSVYSAEVTNGAFTRLLGPMKIGTWSNIGGNATTVPTVSNGQVYVASDGLLTILKVGGTDVLPAAAVEARATSALVLSGTLDSVSGSTLTVADRNGNEKVIDASKAIADGSIAPVWAVGEAYTAFGSSLTSSGVFHADAIYRAKCRQRDKAAGDLAGQPACTADQWPPDKVPGQ